jgi:transcriptional regulator with XRE-family HTH domain
MPEGEAEAREAREEALPGAGGAAASGHNGAVDLPLILGANLKRLRRRQGYSLDRLSQLSGVSRAMIGQIETARSVPTISLLSKVAKALDVEFANLLALQDAGVPIVLRADRARVLSSSGGKFSARALFSQQADGGIEFHEIRIAPFHSEELDALLPGTRKNLVLVRGELAVRTAPGRAQSLNEGDAIEFGADAPHAYRNPAKSEAVAYLVTVGPQPPGA